MDFNGVAVSVLRIWSLSSAPAGLQMERRVESVTCEQLLTPSTTGSLLPPLSASKGFDTDLYSLASDKIMLVKNGELGRIQSSGETLL